MTGKKPRLAVVPEEEIVQMLTFLECVVLSPSLYVIIQLFSSILRSIVALKILPIFTSISENLC